MQSFGWKKKTSLKTSNKVNDVFLNNDSEDLEHENIPVKKLKVKHENSETKVQRLKEEGTIFASEERWWSAIGRWNSALQLDPNNFLIHEMLAQAYMQV